MKENMIEFTKLMLFVVIGCVLSTLTGGKFMIMCFLIAPITDYFISLYKSAKKVNVDATLDKKLEAVETELYKTLDGMNPFKKVTDER